MEKIQELIRELYGKRDNERDFNSNVLWFVEETGELVRAIRKGDRDNLEEEFADVLAWLATLANIKGVNLEKAFYAKYPSACGKCMCSPCKCPLIKI